VGVFRDFLDRAQISLAPIARNLPLLFIGDEFTHTDIVSALA
jgi:uncharacterized protein with PIN domain